MATAGRLVLYAGLVLAALGLALMLMGRAGWSWRPWPGDILIRRPGVVVLVPVTTMLLVSVLGTLLLGSCSTGCDGEAGDTLLLHSKG